MFNWVIIMKNNTTFKIIILVIGILGYLFIGVKNMSPKVTVTFIFCWTIFILAALFVLSPEIKELVFKKDRLELKRYKQKVDKALVEYDEFKNTIYPLLEASMAQIVSVRYLQMPPKSSVMISYVPLVERAIRAEKLDQPEIRELLKAIKAMTLYGFSVELGKIADKSSGGKIEQTSVESVIKTGLEEDYSKKVYVHTDEIDVDFVALDSIAQELPDNPDKHRYERRLKQLEDFYNRYYVD